MSISTSQYPLWHVSGTVRGETWHGATSLAISIRVSQLCRLGVGFTAVVLCRAGAPVLGKEHSVCADTSF